MGGNSPAGFDTTTQTTTPGNASFQQAGLGQAQGLLNNGQSTYAAMNGAQTDAATRLINMGSQGSTVVPAAANQAQSTLSGQYLNANPANGNLSFLGSNGMNTDYWQQNMGRIAGDALRNPASSMLQQTANGSMLNGNPYLDATFSHAMDGVQQRVGSAMAGAGRFGSGAMSAALTDGAGNLSNQIYGQNYQQERDRQLAAQNQIGNFYNQGLNLNLNASNNAATLRQNDARTMLGALSQQSQAYQSERDNMMRAMMSAPQLEQARYLPAQMEAMGGQMFQQNDQNNINGQYDKVNRYLSQIGQAPMGGTSTVSTPFYSNGFNNALGAGTGLAQLAQQIPWGSLASGAGALGSSASNWLNGGGGGVTDPISGAASQYGGSMPFASTFGGGGMNTDVLKEIPAGSGTDFGGFNLFGP